jgi:hypothetical protein
VSFKNIDFENIYDIKKLPFLLKYFREKNILPPKYLINLLKHGIAYLEKFPNVVNVNRVTFLNPNTQAEEIGTINICGDTHGQYMDFSTIFTPENGGLPSKTNMYLFNGDMVDRGDQSCEILVVLLYTMLASKDTIYINRGNHESADMIRDYGFECELEKKYFHSNDIQKLFEKLFRSLPIATTIENKIFIVHGGIGKLTSNMTISDMNTKIDRFRDPRKLTEPMLELLWSGKKKYINYLLLRIFHDSS